MSQKLDVIIFGATGFTGKYTVLQAIETLKGLKWGVAGRSESKLKQTLNEVSKKAGVDLSKTPLIIADVTDKESLFQMASKCKVVVNTCGPYRFYGEPVVEACIKAGAHHVDVSGEPQYMENMQLKYDQEAANKNVYIISACGFDSIPADLGTVFVEKNFNGVVNSVETYLETYSSGAGSGASINYGTWESAVYGLRHASELKTLRSQLTKTRFPTFSPKLKAKYPFQKSPEDKFCLPFLGADKSVVTRTQRKLFETRQKRPIQVQTYLAFKSLLTTILLTIGGIMFGLMTTFKFGRYLLLNYPGICSLGFVSKDGVSEEKMNDSKFKITFYAKGWDEKLAEPTDKYSTAPTKTLKATVTGTNPGYGTTCAGVLLCATTILKESDKMPGSGGVLTPGAAFYDTELIKNLNNHKAGYKFSIVSNVLL
ncbi:SCCPDH family protein [Megaselia abdita]